jgi:hypothetical protein
MLVNSGSCGDKLGSITADAFVPQTYGQKDVTSNWATKAGPRSVVGHSVEHTVRDKSLRNFSILLLYINRLIQFSGSGSFSIKSDLPPFHRRLQIRWRREWRISAILKPLDLHSEQT